VGHPLWARDATLEAKPCEPGDVTSVCLPGSHRCAFLEGQEVVEALERKGPGSDVRKSGPSCGHGSDVGATRRR
jgi:hypothetical protein